MSDKYRFDDLDEMQLPDSVKQEIIDDIKMPPAPADQADKRKAAPSESPVRKAPKVKTAAKGSSYKQKNAKATDEKHKQEMTLMIVVGVLITVALFFVILWVSGVFNGGGTQSSSAVTMAEPDPDKTGFYNPENIPELSTEGVMGELKQAYYTIDGDLAVVLNLSNGTASEQQVVRINARVFNDKQETIAQQTIDSFDPKCLVPAMGRGEVYFVIERANVVVRNDSLEKLGVTLEIASNPTDGSGNQAPGQSVGDGPKDIAPGRSYYENLGNLPELSAEGVKATIIRAQYTNDGSLALTLSLSNGTAQKQNVSKIDVTLQNGEGAVIASYAFERFDTPCQVESKGFAQVDLVIDASYVSVADDSLAALATTISVSAAPAA